MMIMECILLALMLMLCLLSSITDIKKGIIHNRHIAYFLGTFIALDAFFYFFYAREYISIFFSNLICMICIAFFLFYGNVWAGGDCKLFVTLSLGIPATVYSGVELGPAPGFLILLIVFSVAFVHIIAESVVYSIRDKRWIHFQKQRIRITDLVLNYIFMTGVIYFLNVVLSWCMFNFQITGNMFALMIDFFFILGINSIYDRIPNKTKVLLTILSWGFILSFSIATHSFQLRGIYWKSWILVIAVIIIRSIADKYNYQEIETDSVTTNMILSASTVFYFSKSKVKGLPTNMKEDLSARLTESEADAVKRWGKTSKGLKTVMIVRKMPFALYISIGTILFLLIEEVFIWHII